MDQRAKPVRAGAGIGVGEGEILHIVGKRFRAAKKVVDLLAAVVRLAGEDHAAETLGIVGCDPLNGPAHGVRGRFHEEADLVVAVVLLEQGCEVLGQPQIATAAGNQEHGSTFGAVGLKTREAAAGEAAVFVRLGSNQHTLDDCQEGEDG